MHSSRHWTAYVMPLSFCFLYLGWISFCLRVVLWFEVDRYVVFSNDPFEFLRHSCHIWNDETVFLCLTFLSCLFDTVIFLPDFLVILTKAQFGWFEVLSWCACVPFLILQSQCESSQANNVEFWWCTVREKNLKMNSFGVLCLEIWQQLNWWCHLQHWQLKSLNKQHEQKLTATSSKSRNSGWSFTVANPW